MSKQQKYDVVLADPPWEYYGQQDKWGAAAKFYETMSDQDILDFPLESYLKDTGVAFVWATSPRLDMAIDLLKARGLYYRGVAFVWIKTKKDGTPIKAQGVRPSIVKPLTEFVLAASKVKIGRPMQISSESVVQTVFAPKREHSRKPDEVQDRIDELYPKASKIELFARYARNGWDSWGDEAKNG